ncbi:hypothetical protein [Endozoicomonas sp. 2B-B]
MGKTVYELSFTLSIEELTEWLAYFELQQNPEPPEITSEQQYAQFRNVLD